MGESSQFDHVRTLLTALERLCGPHLPHYEPGKTVKAASEVD